MKPKSLAERVTELEQWITPMRKVLEAHNAEISAHTRALYTLRDKILELEPMMKAVAETGRHWSDNESASLREIVDLLEAKIKEANKNA